MILDITMPYLDGIGVMERLAEMNDAPQVIVLTAFEQESMVQRLIAIGAVYYMVKPFDTATLLERSANSPPPRNYVQENRIIIIHCPYRRRIFPSAIGAGSDQGLS